MTIGTQHINRRVFLKASGLAASGALLGACATGTGSSPGGSSGAVTTNGWTDALHDYLMGPVAQEFTKQSGVKIEPQAGVPFGDYQTRFRTLLAGGAPPDIMRLNDDFLPEISAKGLSKDLVPYLAKSGLPEADFLPTFSAARLPSGQRGLVVASQVRCIFYNKTMFEKAGVPLPPKVWSPDGWTWDDFLETAKKLTKGTEQYGCTVFADSGYEEMWSRNNGGPGAFSEDGKKFTLADPQGAEAIQWVADLSLKHRVQPAWGDIKPADSDRRLFQAGKLGMMLRVSGNIGFFTKNPLNFEWDVAPVPAKVHQYQQGSSVLYIIPESAKHPDQAWDFLKFVISEPGGTLVAQAGLAVPVNRKAAQVIKSPGQYPATIGLLAKGAEQSRLPNITSASATAMALYRPQMERIYTGEMTATAALGAVRGQVESKLSA
jgi:multiple sugar transport system substrate-binding protein